MSKHHLLLFELKWWICAYFAVATCISTPSRAVTADAAVPTATISTVVKNEGYSKLVAWVRDNGGRVDDRLGLVNAVTVVGGSQPQLQPQQPRGCVALDDICAGSELLYCPWKLVLGTQGDTSKVSEDHCQVLRTYADQVRLGNESFWYPYLSMDASLETRIPTVWSDLALEELQGLPPYDSSSSSSSSLTDWFSKTCAGGTPFDQLDDASRHSLLAAITRSAGMRFLPIFDLLNHHNGKLNTRSNAISTGNQLFALVDIAKGSDIYLSYRGQRSTSCDIFSRYGFVESWPQQWAWVDDKSTAGTTTTTTTTPSTTTSSGREHPPQSVVVVDQQQHQRILVLPNGSVAINPPDSMTMWIGSATVMPPTLEELQEQADRHNTMQLTTTQVVRFRDSAIALLEETLPTSVEEDHVILDVLEQELISLEGGGGGGIGASASVGVAETILMDRICAVRYRIDFKKAIHMAVHVANDVLAGKKDADQEF